MSNQFNKFPTYQAYLLFSIHSLQINMFFFFWLQPWNQGFVLSIFFFSVWSNAILNLLFWVFSKLSELIKLIFEFYVYYVFVEMSDWKFVQITILFPSIMLVEMSDWNLSYISCVLIDWDAFTFRFDRFINTDGDIKTTTYHINGSYKKGSFGSQTLGSYIHSLILRF